MGYYKDMKNICGWILTDSGERMWYYGSEQRENLIEQAKRNGQKITKESEQYWR